MDNKTLINSLVSLNNTANLNQGKYWTQGINLIDGCSYVNRACRNCWSFNMKKRFDHSSPLCSDTFWNGVIKINAHFLPRLLKPNQIFCIWNDLLHPKVPTNFIISTINSMKSNPSSIFLVCTKRTHRLVSEIIPLINPTNNIAFGTTVFDLDDISQFYNMLRLSTISSFHTFISFEPYTGSAFSDLQFHYKPAFTIVGHESGHSAEKSDPFHSDILISKLNSLNIPVFTKQLYENNKLLKHGQLSYARKFLFT